MKKVAVLLALLVLAGMVGAVSAYMFTSDDVTKWTLVADEHSGGYSVQWNTTEQAIQIHAENDKGVAYEYTLPIVTRSVNITYGRFTTTNGGFTIGVHVYLKSGAQYVVKRSYLAAWDVLHDVDNTVTVYKISSVSGSHTTGTEEWSAGYVTEEFDWLTVLQQNGVSVTLDDVSKIAVIATVDAGGGATADLFVKSVSFAAYKVTLSLKDALTGQGLTGVTISEGNSTWTVGDGGSIRLDYGNHTLTFEKDGYWSVTKTIDVQSDMSVSVEMYPSSAAFKLENFPADISIPENTIYELTFTLSPIDTSATYNTYLAISGLSDIIEVRKDGSLVSPENGKYYLGDISGDTSISIKFKAGAVGTHGFTLTLTSNDAIMSQTYTTTKTVTYSVEPLPFSVQMPSEWQVGENSLRISESSGQNYLVTVILKNSSGNEVWSDSYAFSPYEAHTFAITVPSEGSYTLELQWNGQTAVYDVQVNPAITLETKTLTVQKGGEGVITLHFKNPSSSVQYYTIVVSGGFLPAEINQSISVAPLSEKDVSIAFAVPEDLTYDAYELNVAVYQGDATVFSDKVAVSISDSGGFSLFGGGSSGGKTLLYVLAGLLVLGGLVWALRRRR